MSIVHQGQKWYETHWYNCKQQYKGFVVMKFGGKGEKENAFLDLHQANVDK